MRAQTEAALGEADVVLFLIDARAGVTPLDKTIAQWLRVQPRPVILVANKVEGRATSEAGLSESYELGLDEPVALSAEHGEGMVELYDALRPYIDAFVEARQRSEEHTSELQSLMRKSYAVFCLKKKKTQHRPQAY